MIQFYDSFTITVLTLLEDCGFCAKGEGGPFVAEGHLRRGGKLPLNTDGGGLSSCHSGMRGIFLIIEAVRQLRGQGGAAQVPGAEVALCAVGSGGFLSGIGTVLLGRDATCHACAATGSGDSDGSDPRPGMEAAEAGARRAGASLLRGRSARRAALQRCPKCGHVQFYPRAVCTACGADPEWAQASGRGSVHTYTVVRQNGMPPFKEELPYVVAMVELPEGVRMMGNVTDCAVDEVGVGTKLEAYAVEFEPGLALPFWRPQR